MSGKKPKKAPVDKPSRSKNKDSDESDAEMDDFDPQAAWDCTVCTYKNRSEAFKCEICDTRKGTSTRKPRLNMNVVQQQQILANALNMGDGKTPKRQTRQRGSSPDSPSSSLATSSKRESSSSSLNHQMETLSPNSGSGKECEKEPPSHKHEKIRNSLVARDFSKKYEITDTDGATVTIIALKSRLVDKELQYVNALRAFDNYNEVKRERIEKARAKYNEEKKKNEEERAKQRLDRENRPKRIKKVKVKKPRKYATKAKLAATLSKTKAGNVRGRPPNKSRPAPKSKSHKKK